MEGEKKPARGVKLQLKRQAELALEVGFAVTSQRPNAMNSFEKSLKFTRVQLVI